MKPQTVTSADVAKHAGVSQSTVSRSFNPSSRISDKTREKVFAAARELGYQVNKAAQTMIRQRSDLVGLVTAGLTDPFRAEFLNALICETQRKGLRPMVIDVSDPETIDSSIQSLFQYQVSGIIVTSCTPSETVATEFLKRGVPVTLVNRADSFGNADIVNIDNLSGGQLAAQSLLKNGCKHLAVVRASQNSFSSVVRTQGFIDYLSQHAQSNEIQVEEIHCVSGDYDGGYQIASALLERPERPDGVFFCMDNIACGFVDAVRNQYGLSIPSDIAVIGFDDIQIASYQAYNLTTIRQCPKTVAEQAIESLLRRLEEPEAPAQTYTIPVETIYRHTLPAPSPE